MAIEGAQSKDNRRPRSELLVELRERGVLAVIVSAPADLDDLGRRDRPELVVLDSRAMSPEELRGCVEECARLDVPALALLAPDRLSELNADMGLADFALTTAPDSEVLARATLIAQKRTKPEEGELIRVADLTINPATYEVAIGGRRVDLRFKEYELLRLLAANPGRVYSREALLSQVWGYDYFGGTRTVDVHIRRLRSKIEDSEHRFIETIWNVGYRFRDPRGPS